MTDTPATSVPPHLPRLGFVGLAGIGLLATLVRLAVVWSSQESGLWADMAEYHDRATLLAAGQPLPDSYRGPGYPVFLALVYALPGEDFWAARVANALLGGVTAVLTGVLAAGFVGARAALGAALATALYPASVLSAVYLMPEGVYGVLLLAAILTTRRLTSGRAVAAGLLSGVATLTRSLGATLPIALLLGHLPRGATPQAWRPFVRHVLLMGATCVVALSPWLAHTRRVSGGLMLDSNSGFNVRLGANPRARERLELDSYAEYFQAYVLGMPNEADRNRRALADSWAWIRENPGRWIALMPRKAAYLYGLEGREHVWLYSNAYFGPRRPFTVWAWAVLLVACFPLLAVPAVVGLMRPGLCATPAGIQIVSFLLLTTILHALTFGETRFHLPLVPFLALLAARGLSLDTGLPGHRQLLAVALMAGLAAGWWSQWPEVVDQVGKLTAPDGWKLALPY